MASLNNILREIHNGKHYVNSMITDRAYQILGDFYMGKNQPKSITEEKPNTLPAAFSNTELDILRLIARGYNNKEIAKSLYLKDGTVRNYISSILQKAGVKNRTQVVLYAQKYGLARKVKMIADVN